MSRASWNFDWFPSSSPSKALRAATAGVACDFDRRRCGRLCPVRCPCRYARLPFRLHRCRLAVGAILGALAAAGEAATSAVAVAVSVAATVAVDAGAVAITVAASVSVAVLGARAAVPTVAASVA